MRTLGIAAVQLRLSLAELASEGAFQRAVWRAAQAASDAVKGADHRLFVYPEAVGHLAVLARASAFARRRATLSGAVAAIAARRPAAVLAGMWEARKVNPRAGAVAAIADETEALVRETFAEVARRHGATVVAGSHFCRTGQGGVTNRSFTFDPAGALVGVTDKVNLVPGLEDDAPGGLGLTAGRADAIPVLKTGFGRLATLICYDGFAVAHTPAERFACAASIVDDAGADVVANPAANPWPWHGPWALGRPGDERLRREQWAEEGLPAALAGLRRVRYGVTAQLCAEVLDVRFDGRSQILERRGGDGVRVVAEAKTHDQADIVAAAVPACEGATARRPGSSL